MINFNRTTILVALGLALAMYVGIYFNMTLSPSFKAAKNFLETSETLKKEIGTANRVSLNFFGRSSSRTSGGRTEAHYEFTVTGEQGSGTAKVDVASQNEGWEILKAELVTRNDLVIPLNKKN